MGAYDRPSWREIDRRKDGSSGKRRNRRERNEKREHSTRYDRYKADLNRLFDQGLAGELLKKTGRPGGSNENTTESDNTKKKSKTKGVIRRKGNGRIPKGVDKSTSRFKLIREIIDSSSIDSLVPAIDELVKNFGLPNDWDVLVRFLEHPDESLVSKAITRMIEILATKEKVSRKASLKERLRGIGQTATEMDLRQKAEELESLL